MASYSQHDKQAQTNLIFLRKINTDCNEHIDWQVTTCFYVGVHLVNGFLAQEKNMHFNSHERVCDAISPESKIIATRLPDNEYLAYTKLRNLSRRSRYLTGEHGADEAIAHLTSEKHFIKAFRMLDKLMQFFRRKYGASYPVTPITYQFTKPTPALVHFTFNKPQQEKNEAA